MTAGAVVRQERARAELAVVAQLLLEREKLIAQFADYQSAVGLWARFAAGQ